MNSPLENREVHLRGAFADLVRMSKPQPVILSERPRRTRRPHECRGATGGSARPCLEAGVLTRVSA
jgi:hypothetical protein